MKSTLQLQVIGLNFDKFWKPARLLLAGRNALVAITITHAAYPKSETDEYY